MPLRQFGYELAVVAIVCVLGLFLFPASAGPYCAVHGPTTALLAIRFAVRVRCAMAIAALRLFQFAIQASFRHMQIAWHLEAALPALSLSPILRC